MKVEELIQLLQLVPSDSEVALWDGYSAYSKGLAEVSTHMARGIRSTEQIEEDLTKPVVVLTWHPTHGYGLFPKKL